MKRDELQRADALDHYWDAIQRGDRPPESAEIDQFTSAVVTVLNERRAPAQFSAVQRTVRLRVVKSTTPYKETPMHALVLPAPPRSMGGEINGSRLFKLVPLAAVLVLIAAIGYFIAGSDENNSGSSVPAAFAPATPSPQGSTKEILLTLSIPESAMPAPENVSAGLAHITIPVGNRSSWQPYCCPGPMIEYVVAGTYAVRAETPIQIIRSDGTVEEIAANNDVTLGPGDSLIASNETTIEATNTGAVPVELLSWVLIEDVGTFGGHALPGWAMGSADVNGRVEINSGAAIVHLFKVTAMDGDIIPSLPEGTQFAVALDAKTFTAKSMDGSIKVLGTAGKQTTVYILTLEPGDDSGAPGATPAS